MRLLGYSSIAVVINRHYGRLAFSGMALMLLTHAVLAEDASLVIPSIENTYVNSRYPSAIATGEYDIYIQNRTGNEGIVQEAYLKFQLPKFTNSLLGAIVEIVRNINQASPGATISLYSAPNETSDGFPWSVSSLKWSNKPETGELLATLPVSSVSDSIRDSALAVKAYHFDGDKLDAYLNKQDPEAEVSFRIVISDYENEPNLITIFRDQHDSNYNPALILNVVPKP